MFVHQYREILADDSKLESNIGKHEVEVGDNDLAHSLEFGLLGMLKLATLLRAASTIE